MQDRRILFAAAFLRAMAVGMIGVLIAIYLAKRGFDPAAIGVIVGAGLAGAASAALLATLLGDRIGRRRTLVALGVLGAAGAMGMAVADTALVPAAVAAFVGMINGMGRDRGAGLIMDTAILPSTAPDSERTAIFAWYNVIQDVGGAIGALCAGLPARLVGMASLDELTSLQASMGIYAALVLATGILPLRLSPAAEAPKQAVAKLEPHTKRVLAKISVLFFFDSLGGGFITTALIAFFFYQRFGVSVAVAGALFFLARLMNAVSHLVAARLARRIGLVNTMVFTHIPSSFLLVTLAWAPSFPVAAILFLLREGLVEMDVPTRQSYVMAVVHPHERIFAAGVTSLVRISAWAVGPFFAGFFMQGAALAAPLFVGAAIKIAYDLALWVAFRRLKPPEERAASS